MLEKAQRTRSLPLVLQQRQLTDRTATQTLRGNLGAERTALDRAPHAPLTTAAILTSNVSDRIGISAV